MKIFFSVGEPSGDLHGANLARDIRARCPHAELIGFGGPRMAEAGCRLDADLTKLAVMWFLRALLNLHKFAYLLWRADRTMSREQPDAVVLIDYPGFNWWIARRAKAHGIPVFYYGAPQIWAWAGWRINKMQRLVDHVLCKLPFESDWYRERGCDATYVGHPYFDETRRRQLDSALLQTLHNQPGRLVAILPGSRSQEVQANLPWFLKAASLIRRTAPDVRFAVAAFNESQAELARDIVAEAVERFPVYVGKTPELIEASECCMACSGSVSLEMLHHEKPAVILYYISRFAFFVQGFFRRVKYITLVNLFSTDDLFPEDVTPFDPEQPDADKTPYPEYLTCEDKSAQIAAHIGQWLTDEAVYKRRVRQLQDLRSLHGGGGASQRAADYLLDTLGAPGQASPCREAA